MFGPKPAVSFVCDCDEWTPEIDFLNKEELQEIDKLQARLQEKDPTAFYDCSSCCLMG